MGLAQPFGAVSGSCLVMKLEPDVYRLALRAREGDTQALALLIAQTRARLFALAYAELRHYDDAQDAVAAALLRICRHIRRLQEPERVEVWMRRIVRNEARRLLMHRKTGQELSEAMEVAPQSDDIPTSLLRMDIERALARLPGDQARAVRLFHLASQPINDIAERLGCSVGTVKSWLHRARRQLAATMEDYRPMEPLTPSPTALILHTDLSPKFLDQLKTALEAADFAPTLLTSEETTRLLAQWKEGNFSLLETLLKKHPLVLLDERIGGRSAFELLLTIGALLPGSKDDSLRLGLLCADPWGSTAFAAWNAGVHLLINTNDPSEWDRIGKALQRLRRTTKQMGRGFAAKAKWASNTMLALVVQMGVTEIEPDHLALVLLKDEDQASYKALQTLGVDIAAVRQELLHRLGGPTVTPAPLRDFLEAAGEAHKTERFHRVEELTYAEAWQSRARLLSTAHLLIGLLRAGNSAAAALLAEHGVEVAALRAASVPFSAEEDAESDAYYANEEAQFQPLWERAWARAGEYVRP